MNRLAHFSRRLAAGTHPRFPKQTFVARGLSSTFSDREKGEEARFFRQEEERLKSEARAKFEELLAKDDSDTQKQQLLEQLAPPEKEGFVERNDLNHLAFWAPVNIFLWTYLVQTGNFELNQETWYVGVFMLIAGTAVRKVTPVVSQYIKDVKKEQAIELEKINSSIVGQANDDVATAKEVADVDVGVKEVFQLLDDLHAIEADTLNKANALAYREAVAKKLDGLVALEDKIAFQVKSRLVADVKADVTRMLTEKKTKEAALEQALAVLAGGKGAKLGTDVVGNAFKASIANYRDNYSKKGGKDDILVQLEKEIASLATPPHLNAAGGNVYETNPVLK